MKRVFVGLSGGVDSSVAAALLKQEGYDVTGVYMKNWTQDLPGVECPWKQDLADARAVAAHLDIPFRVYDFQEQYRANVVDYMIAEYQSGRTPNPDVMCNQEIKFKLFLGAALADGADMIATGHYARAEGGKLLRGVDDNKDQTYFLYRVTSEALGKTLMPIGDYTKPQVRKLAAEFGLPTAGKRDSQGICFVGPVGMKAFLSQYVETQPGAVVNNRGQHIGKHDGAIFFTIGQRQGLGLSGGPWYVTGKNMSKNEVYVTDDPADLELHSDEVILEDVHWIAEPANLESPISNLLARLRHRGDLVDASVIASLPQADEAISKIASSLAPRNDEKGSLRLKLAHPQRGMAAGQSAVLYEGDVALGGGIITTPVPATSIRIA